MFVGYGKHPFLIALQGHPSGVGESPSKRMIYMA